MPFLAHRDKTRTREQTVEEHCCNVSRLCRKTGEKIGLGSTAALIGLLHDSGKAKKEFQAYLDKNDPSLRGSVNHSTCGARYLFDRCQNGAGAQPHLAHLAALVICSHHGGLINFLSPRGEEQFKERIQSKKEIYYEESIRNFLDVCAQPQEIDQLVQQACVEIEHFFLRLIQAFPGSKNEPRIFALGLTVRYLLSCLLDADRYDTYCFETNQSPASEPANCPAWGELAQRLEEYLLAFNSQSEINRLRGEISQSCREFASNPTGIYQLFVPTGGGKTLASLRYALHAADIHRKKRILYVIPFKTIIDQNAKQIRAVLKRDDLILEHHSDVLTDDKDETYKLLTERWDAPIILTTMVQFLNTLFDGGTQAARRMHNLADSVIIFDEIQALPVKCISMFNNAVDFLHRICGTSIVLCTATQPQLASAQLPVPLHLSTPANMIADYEEKFAQFRRTRVVDARIRDGYTAPKLAEFVMQKGEDSTAILVVLNTKRSARRLHGELKLLNASLPKEQLFTLFHLSTSLCPEHRQTIIKELEARLKQGERLICISTQLIEAGVDLSFNCVIRSFAGLDSIAQAAGRCNRHGESPCRDVFIIKDAEESLSKLPDIRLGQDASERVLDEFHAHPETFDNDLLSPKSIERFYLYYYYDQDKVKHQMGYPVKKGQDTKKEIYEDSELYDLLTENATGHDRLQVQRSVKDNIWSQAFHTAGRLFQVIEEDTLAVVVPYQGGKALIGELETEKDLKKISSLLRKAQRYSVNLYAGDQKKLKYALRTLECGVTVLEEGYYNMEYGVTDEYSTDALIQ